MEIINVNLPQLETAFWAEVERLALIRGQASVSPLSREVAHSVFTAGLLALEDRVTGRRVHRTLASQTGTGKTTYAGAFASALLKTDPSTSILFVCADIRQADETYRELARVIEENDLAIWTSGHDAGTPLEKIKSNHEGFEPSAPRFWKGDLVNRRLIVVTHKLYVERGGVRGLSYLEQPRTLHLIDERLDEVQIIDIDQGDAAKARDTALMVEGEDAPVTKALHDLHAHLNHLWETGAMREGSSYEAMRNKALDWFTSEAAEEAQRHAKSPSIAEAIAFGRSLVTGHAFLARYPEANKGGRFLGYRLVLPIIPGSVLMDGSSDIDGVNQIATWRAPVKPPKVTFDRLSIKHVPFPIVDPEGYRKTVAQITDSADLSRRYVKWLKEKIVAETEPGESILVVTHRALVAQEHLPKCLTFDDPLVMEGERKVAFLTYGKGVGSNKYKAATTVIVAGEFYRPHRVTMGSVLGLANVTADHPYLGEMANVNTRHALFTTIKNGTLLRWIKQLAMRGAARNFDDNGVCGRMKLVAIGDLDLWARSYKLMFPGASFDVSEDTEAIAKAAGGSKAVAAFILAHKGDGFTSKDLCIETGITPANLARCLKSAIVKASLASAGLSYVPGKGRTSSCFICWSPVAVAAE